MRSTTGWLFLSVLLLGCADAKSPLTKSAPSPEAISDEERNQQRAKDKGGPKDRAQEPAGRGAARDPEAAAAGEEVQRKIIYTASIDVVVDDMDKAQAAVATTVEEAKGYIAKSELRAAPNSPRDGSWTIRVPVAKFNSLRAALTSLGTIRRNAVDSEDVTDRFYDTEARLKSNKVEEEGLRKLYLEKSATSKIEDLLAVRREMSNVRGTIEQQQGQINRWDQLSRLATIQLHLVEIRDYEPPSQPGFGASIADTFRVSRNAIVGLGKFLVLVVVALVPWSPLLALIAFLLWRLIRHVRQPPTLKPATPTESAHG